MLFRRNIALAAGALLLAAPFLSSCGFNYATDRINTNGAGVNNRDKTVNVLGAVIVAGQANSGTFIASFSNGSQTEPDSFDTLSGSGGNTVTADDFQPIEIPAAGLVNLAVDGGVRLTGEFEAGDFIPVSVGFANGDRVVLNVPVVTNCGMYEGLDSPPVGIPVGETASSAPTAESTPYPCEQSSVGTAE